MRFIHAILRCLFMQPKATDVHYKAVVVESGEGWTRYRIDAI